MGNSEVGHLNIGAGRKVYQDLVKINLAIRDNSIADNPVLKDAFNLCKENDKAVHFLGLVSDGGVHSSDKHLYKLCDITGEYGLTKFIYMHLPMAVILTRKADMVLSGIWKTILQALTVR
jgi:2,3-bisphosphoglycerate-independent phosphoglycerate mutase